MIFFNLCFFSVDGQFFHRFFPFFSLKDQMIFLNEEETETITFQISITDKETKYKTQGSINSFGGQNGHSQMGENG